MSVTVDVARKALYIPTHQARLEQVRNVYGQEWDKKAGVWKFPMDLVAVEDLVSVFDGQIQFSNKAQKWVNHERWRYEQIEEALTWSERIENSATPDKEPLPPLRYDSPAGLALMPHQVTMVNYMAAARRCLDTDIMGLGKTIETIAALREIELRSGANPDWPAELKVNDKMPRYLIICPNSMRYTWRREIRTWHPRDDMPVHIVQTGKEGWGHQGWFICNWELFWRRIDAFLVLGWDAIIGDESHRAKDPNSKQTQGLFRLDNSWNRFLLSGTPIRNHVPDLWPQLHWLDGRRFNSYWKFVGNFVETEEGVGRGGRRYKEFVGTKNEDQLRRVLRTIVFGRQDDSKEVTMRGGINLPTLIGPRIVKVELGERQRQVYDQMRDEFVAIIEAEEPGERDVVIKSPNWMTHALRLKQIAGSLGIFSEEHDDSAKLEQILERAYNAEGEKHVAMSQFRTMAMIYHSRLKKDKVPHIVLTGQGVGSWHPDQSDTGYLPFVDDRNKPDRDAAQVAFNSDPVWKHFVATTQTGGEGITLVGARYFHFMDLMWTPAENDQAWHRVYRKGQERTTFVFAYLAVDTIDFSGILPTLDTKGAIIDAVFGLGTSVPLTLEENTGQRYLEEDL
jgi:SNF2 family DNA or RNA helicase